MLWSGILQCSPCARPCFHGFGPIFIFCAGTILSRVDKQECATPDLSCTICRYPAPTAEFFVYVTFFQRNAALPQSSVRARAGHRPCSVKPSQVHEGKLSKRLAARASSKRLRQQKIPPWVNPSASCTLLFIYSWYCAYMQTLCRERWRRRPVNCWSICCLPRGQSVKWGLPSSRNMLPVVSRMPLVF